MESDQDAVGEKTQTMDPCQLFSEIVFKGVADDGNPSFEIRDDHSYVCSKTAIQAPFPSVYTADQLSFIDSLSGCNRVLSVAPVPDVADEWDQVRFTRVSRQDNPEVDYAALIVSVEDTPNKQDGADYLFLPAVSAEIDYLMKRLDKTATTKQVLAASDPKKAGVTLLPKEARRKLEEYDFSFTHALSSNAYKTMTAVQKTATKPRPVKPQKTTTTTSKKPGDSASVKKVVPTVQTNKRKPEEVIDPEPKKGKPTPTVQAMLKTKPPRKRSTASKKKEPLVTEPSVEPMPTPSAPPPDPLPAAVPPPASVESNTNASFDSDVRPIRMTFEIWIKPGENVFGALTRLLEATKHSTA